MHGKCLAQFPLNQKTPCSRHAATRTRLPCNTEKETFCINPIQYSNEHNVQCCKQYFLFHMVFIHNVNHHLTISFRILFALLIVAHPPILCKYYLKSAYSRNISHGNFHRKNHFSIFRFICSVFTAAYNAVSSEISPFWYNVKMD